MKVNNNCYYTNDNIASNIVKTIDEILDINSYDFCLEPSAGRGVFFNILYDNYNTSNTSIIGIDIEPSKIPLILNEDFLTYNTDHLQDKNVLVIGNPPFSPLSLLNGFIKKICSISNAFALIVPKSFKKQHRIKLIDDYFHEVYTTDIPKNSYNNDGVIYDIKTILIIYQKKDYKRNNNMKEVPNQYYKFVKNTDDFDIAIRRVGCKCSYVFFNNKDGTNYNKNTNYFIKFRDCSDLDIVVKYYHNRYLLDESINNVVGQKSLSKQVLIPFLNGLF